MACSNLESPEIPVPGRRGEGTVAHSQDRTPWKQVHAVWAQSLERFGAGDHNRTPTDLPGTCAGDSQTVWDIRGSSCTQQRGHHSEGPIIIAPAHRPLQCAD